MKIILVGAFGTIGREVGQTLLALGHELICVSRTQGDYRLDMADASSIESFYSAVGSFDALVVTAGEVHFGLLQEMKAQDWQVGLQSKLMGQVQLVTQGLKRINSQGSFTLTSGILSQDPIRFGVQASMVNGAIESFVKAAAIELEKGVRINCVSPTLLTESVPQYGEYFRGYPTRTAQEVAKAYIKSIEGRQTGQVYTVF